MAGTLMPDCAHFSPDIMLYNGDLSLPWQMIIYLTVGLVVMVGVSLFTKPPAKEKLDRIYECLRTPVMPGETRSRTSYSS